MKLNLEKLVNGRDKDFMTAGALIGLLGSAAYGTLSNIHSFKDFIEIGMEFGPAYWRAAGDFLKTSLYAVPVATAVGYVASKVSNLFDK